MVQMYERLTRLAMTPIAKMKKICVLVILTHLLQCALGTNVLSHGSGGSPESTNIIENPDSVEIIIDPNLRMVNSLLQTAFMREDYRKELEKKVQLRMEFLAPSATILAGKRGNSLFEAVHTAYSYHLPLRLSPDMIWLAILQGVAYHVNENSEELRGKFVNFTGKQTITVVDHSLILGSPYNNWTRVLGKFSTELNKRLAPNTVTQLLSDFTTTRREELAASQVVLMDIVSKYFSYRVFTMCGIPQIKLEGTVADWQRLLAKAINLKKYNLSWWIDELQPVLEELVATANGDVNFNFWKSIYKHHWMGSGNPFVTGWLTMLFPYITSGTRVRRNPAFTMRSIRSRNRLPKGNFSNVDFVGSALTSDVIPLGISKVPFVWEYYYNEINMTFLAGFLGIEQDPDSLYISPWISYAIAYNEPPTGHTQRTNLRFRPYLGRANLRNGRRKKKKSGKSA